MNFTHQGRGRWAAQLAAVAGVLVAASAHATGSAVLTGTVIDAESKKPAADVVVTVTSPALQGEQIVVTDRAGQFRIPSLPPGSYTLRLEKETFRPYSRGGIELRIDSTIRVNSELLPETLKAEEIVVTSAPTVDVGSSTTGVNVSSDFVSRIPLNATSSKGAATRSFESLAEVAPGAVADRYGVSISGTTSPENQYVIDGLSVNNPAFGIIGTPLSVEFIKEVNVITGGYMPEYGRSTGGTLNVETKSGSNEFHGAVFFGITPGAFEAARKPVLREGNTISTDTTLSSLRDFGAEIGGPILKDKLWFYVGVSQAFASYRLERNLNIIRLKDGQAVKENDFTQTDRLPGTDEAFYATQKSFQYLTKLTFLVDQDNSVSLSVYGSPTTSGGDGAFGINPRDGSPELNNTNSNNIVNGTYGALAHEYVSRATDAALKWSSAFQNKNYLLDVTLGIHHEDSAIRAADGTELASGQGLSGVSQTLWQQTSRFVRDPATGNDVEEPHLHSINDFERTPATKACDDAPAGFENGTLCPVSTYYTGGPSGLQEASLDRYQGKAVLTGLFSGLGHHVAKVGFDAELMRYDSARGYSGSNTFNETTDGTAFTDFRRFGFLVGPDDPVVLAQFHAVSKSTTLGGFAQDSWSILDRVTLNAGVRYDAQLLYGSDGNLAMSLPNQWSPRVGVIYDFTQSGRSKLFVNFSRFYESVPLDVLDRSIPGERQFNSTHDAAKCDPRIVSQQQNECESDDSRIANRNTYSPNQKWGIVGSDKSPVDPDLEPQSSDELVIGGEYEVISKVRIGAQYTKRYQNRVIEDMSRDEAQTYFIGNPGYGVARDFPKPIRNYDAFTIYAEKRFGDTWLAQASYTASYLRGNWAGLFRPENGQLDPNINSDFDLRSLLDNREGPLPGDRTHALKLFGAKDIAFTNGFVLNLGGAYRASSGSPTSFLGSHPIYGPEQSYILPRGSGERTPWVHDIDAHVGAGFQLAKQSLLLVSIDAFNLFNFQQVTDVDQRYTQDSVLPIVGGTKDRLDKLQNSDGTPFDPTHKNKNFGNPTAYQPPRTFRISAKVTF